MNGAVQERPTPFDDPEEDVIAIKPDQSDDIQAAPSPVDGQSPSESANQSEALHPNDQEKLVSDQEPEQNSKVDEKTSNIDEQNGLPDSHRAPGESENESLKSSIPEGSMALEQSSPALSARAKRSVTPRSTLDARVDDLAQSVQEAEEEAPPRPPAPQAATANTLPYSGRHVGLEQQPVESVFAKARKSIRRRVNSFKRDRQKPPSKVVGRPEPRPCYVNEPSIETPSVQVSSTPTASSVKKRQLFKTFQLRTTVDIGDKVAKDRHQEHIYVNQPVSSRVVTEEHIYANSQAPNRPKNPFEVEEPIVSVATKRQHAQMSAQVDSLQGSSRISSPTYVNEPGGYSQTLRPMDYSFHYQSYSGHASPTLSRSATMGGGGSSKPKSKTQWYKHSKSIELPSFKRKKRAPQPPQFVQSEHQGTLHASPYFQASKSLSLKPPAPQPPTASFTLGGRGGWSPYLNGRGGGAGGSGTLGGSVIAPTLRLPLSAEPAIVRKVMTMQRGAPPPPPLTAESSHQLSSLQNPELSAKVNHTNTVVVDCLRKLLTSTGPGVSTEHGVELLPYVSDKIASESYQATLVNLCGKLESMAVDALDNQKAIDDSLVAIHPFLKLWSSAKTDSTGQHQHYFDEGISGLRQYMQSCVNLRSVDLQGHYAAFHRPLDSFNRKAWTKRTTLIGWNDLLVLREPKTNTEFVELKGVEEDHLYYATKSVNNILMTWINCQQTKPPSSGGTAVSQQTPQRKINPDGTVSALFYHPVLLAVAYTRLKDLDTHTGDNAGLRLWSACLKLAILLTYQHYLESAARDKFLLDTDPNRILVTLSPCNALIAFHCKHDSIEMGSEDDLLLNGSDHDVDTEAKRQEHEAAIEQQSRDFVQSMCPSAGNNEEAINQTIEAIYAEAEQILKTANITSVLLKALTPPDWIMEVVARICLKKHPITDMSD